MSVQKVIEGSELELAKVPVEYQMWGRRVAPEGAAGPSVHPGEVVGAYYCGP